MTAVSSSMCNLWVYFVCFFFFFCSWMEPLFCVGFRRDLSEDDLYVHPSEADSEKLLKKFRQ